MAVFVLRIEFPWIATPSAAWWPRSTVCAGPGRPQFGRRPGEDHPPLLGVGGYCLICHGRSESKAIKNAIRVGKQLVTSGVNEKIVETIAHSIPVEEE